MKLDKLACAILLAVPLFAGSGAEGADSRPPWLPQTPPGTTNCASSPAGCSTPLPAPTLGPTLKPVTIPSLTPSQPPAAVEPARPAAVPVPASPARR